ncbi:MAG: hypothetical protein HKN13_13415 [Rhodothermales bacterium]|nr:hypothetical protein [Rhodothermales bacterium]
MLYLISGASRSGKTLAAKKILADRQIPYLSLDWIMMGFTNGIPEYGIHDKLFPNEIAQRLWPFLKSMLKSMIHVEVDCVIEGEAILPGLVKELQEAYPEQIRVCFVGYTDIEVDEKVRAVKDFSEGTNDWLNKESDEYIVEHITNMVTYSRRIRASCEEHGMRYFDTSTDFLGAIDEAIRYLLKE